jgi:hypothetical protein
LLHDRPADSTPLRYRGGRFFGIRADNRRHLNGLVALDQNCRVLFDRFLDHPEASEVRIYAADSLDDGIVAAGWIQDRSGRTAGVIWMLSPDGEVRSVIRTNPFHGKDVAVDTQRRIWALGVDLEGHDQLTDLPILQCFRADGVKLDEFLPRGSFPRKRAAPPANVTNEGVPFLAAGDDRVVVYIPQHGEWIEVVPSTREVSRIPVPAPLDSRPLAAARSLPFRSGAMLSDGEVFGWFGERSLYQLDRKSRSWVARPKMEGLAFLAGANDTALVGLRRSRGGNPEALWFPRP